MKDKLDCCIVQDLLPLYVDGLTSELTNERLEQHLAECEECSRVFERMREPEQHEKETVVEVDYLKKIRARMGKSLLISGVLVAILVIGIFAGLLLYDRIVPKKYAEIYAGKEAEEFLIHHSESDTEMEFTDVECKTFHSLLAEAEYYYKGRQGNKTKIQGEGYYIVSMDSYGNNLFEFCITDEHYVYANDKVYNIRNDEKIMEFIELRIVSEPEWIEWEQEKYSFIDGRYVAENDEDLGLLGGSVSFDLEKHTCKLPLPIISSVFPGGTFRIKDDKIIAKGLGELTYIFEIVDDETIRFVQEGSSQMELGDESCLPDGTIFKRE